MKQKKDLKPKGRKAFRYRDTECLNCGQPLDTSDVYCPYCSQLNSNKQLSAKDFLGEFLTSIFVYDSRLRNTLKDLLLRPGVITRNYIKGQRLNYANPFRFFLSVSIIYFVLYGLIGILNPTNQSNLLNFDTDNEKNISLDSLQKILNREKDNANIPINLDSLQTILKEKNIGSVDNIFINLDSIKKLKDSTKIDYISETTLDTMSFAESFGKRLTLYQEFYSKNKIKDPVKALDSLKHKNTGYNRWLYSKNNTWEKIKENPTAFLNYLMAKIPFFLFFFTPFYALFFWLVYSKRRYSYMEHMVFIFHIFSFIFLAMLIFTIPDFLLGSQFFLGALFFIIGPFYFYKALRNFYQQNRVVTLIKFVFLSIIFTFGFSFAALLFVAVSAAIY